MRKVLVVVSLVASLLPVGAARAIPPVIASDNVDLIANIPDVPAIGAKILGNTMYVTTLQGLRIYDVSVGVPVLIGGLELPHWQNEWVDTNGKTLLISADNVINPISVVFVIDVTIPQAPLIRGVVEVDHGHTATCIKDCQFAWTRGRDVLDLREYLNPKRVGRLNRGVRHHVDVDAAGIAWLDGSLAVDTNDYGDHNLFSPTVVASGGPYGWHGSLRPDAEQATPDLLANSTIDPGELVLGTDEIWLAAQNDFCANDGPFRTSWYRTVNGKGVIEPLDVFRIGRGTLPGSKPLGVVACSSHWFDEHEGVVANGWYEQGVRFLDVSNPRDIRQIGYFMPPVTEAWGARFHVIPEGPTAGVYVYTFDVARGIDVLRWNGKAGDETVLAPLNPAPAAAVQPSAEYGWACRILGTNVA